FFFSSRRRHTSLQGDWSSDVCSSDLLKLVRFSGPLRRERRGKSDELETSCFGCPLPPAHGHVIISPPHVGPPSPDEVPPVGISRSEERRVGTGVIVMSGPWSCTNESM